MDNVEIKALSKVGTFAGQVYWNGKMDIDADCTATNVSIETVGGMAGKVFGLLINNATGDTTKVTITGDTTVAFDNLLAYPYGADETSNKLVIKGGTFTEATKAEIEACLADGYSIAEKNGDYVVVKD